MKKLDRNLENKFVSLARENEKKGQRLGLAFYNALYKIDRELCEEIRYSEYDCFCDDSIVPKFLTRVLS